MNSIKILGGMYLPGEVVKTQDNWHREFVYVSANLDTYHATVFNAIDSDHREDDIIWIAQDDQVVSDTDNSCLSDDVAEIIKDYEIENLNHCDPRGLEVKNKVAELVALLEKVDNDYEFKQVLTNACKEVC